MSLRPIAIRAAAEAMENVGVIEIGGENRGRWVEQYQSACDPPIPPGSPWCAAFVVFRLRNAAHDLGLPIPASWPRSGYCPDHRRWAVNNGRWLSVQSVRDGGASVRVGDLALFYFKRLGRIAHIGIVVEVHPWGVVTVEGNTSEESEDGSHVDRDGDGVWRKRRDWSELGAHGGFVRIDW